MPQGEALGRVAAAILARRAQGPECVVVVGLDGPVAVGKSTLAAQLAERLQAAGTTTAVVAADGFLWPTARMREMGLIARKGFPESFDRHAMATFLQAVRRGDGPAAARYSHAAYDVVAEPAQATAEAAVVIFEGVNVLGADLAPLYDLRLYLEAEAGDVEGWFLQRFMATPFSPVRTAALAPWRPADGDVEAWGRAVWAGVNGPNLAQHIAKGRARADVVLHKAADHALTLGA